jgi:hypothetical protein
MSEFMLKGDEYPVVAEKNRVGNNNPARTNNIIALAATNRLNIAFLNSLTPLRNNPGGNAFSSLASVPSRSPRRSPNSSNKISSSSRSNIAARISALRASIDAAAASSPLDDDDDA